MNLSDNARTVLEKRYLTRDENGRVTETPEQLFRRVADTIALQERKYDPDANWGALSDAFYRMMTELDFLPNSPTLMNAGKPLGQLSACFVLPVEDSLEEIFEAIKQAALIHKSGGGTGFSFTRLRPKGSSVRSTGGVASGPVSFMKVFNAATEAVKQGGTRRGANMGVLRIDHPDIEEFITCKKDPTQLTNFNISVALTDKFMSDLASGQPRAVMLFDELVEAAWRSGEPGILFLDRINCANVTPGAGEIEATNPCGEQPLLPYECCNLGSVNLSNMMLTEERGVDWDKLGKTVRLAVRFLDNVITANKYPLEIIRERTEATRKIGLGVMGLHDLLLKLGLAYNSDEAVELGRRLMAFIHKHAAAASEALGRERGVFPLCAESTLEIPRRNATVTTIAPTGTLSMIAGVSSGIEPMFAYSYTRHILDGSVLHETHPLYADASPEERERIFVTAHDIPPEWHIKMQAAFQENVDNAVSKTINFPASATQDEVREAFLLSYRLGCKGITIYRDGSRSGQALQKAEPAEPEDAACLDCVLPHG